MSTGLSSSPLYGDCMRCGRSDARVLSQVSRIGICPACGDVRIGQCSLNRETGSDARDTRIHRSQDFIDEESANALIAV